MNLTFQTSQLKSAYTAAAAAVPTRTAKDVLKCILLQSTPHYCRLIGGDAELIVSAALPIQEHFGEVLLPAVLGQILRETVSETISITSWDGKIIVKAGGSRFVLTTGDAAEYPPPPDPAGEARTLLGATLSAAIDATIHAIDNDSTRYALAGVAFDGDSVVATDSRRLAVYTLPEAVVDQQIKVPTKAAQILRRSFGLLDHVQVRTDGNTATFTSDSISVHCRLLEGRFPKWRDVIPSQWEITCFVPVSDLLKAVRSAAVTTDKDDTGIRLEIGLQSIRLTSSGASGDSEQVVDCHSDGAVSLRVGALFLAQALAALPADQTVTLRAIDPEAAILLELSGIRQIVMPLVTPEAS
jgi:DNA polymerase-3 subunit beta